MRVLSKLTMLVLSGLLMGGCEAPTVPELPPAVGRPEGTSQGPRAAVVVAVRGTAEIQPSQGLAFPARPEQQLLRDDRIVTGADSLVVVALHNGHVVRLSPGTLRVDMLAAFNEKPAGDDLEQRFDQLLTPDERQDPELRGAIARVAGWNTRMTAAETIAPQPASTPRPTEPLERLDAPPPPEEDAKKAAETAPGDPGSRRDVPVTDRPTTPSTADGTPPKNRPPEAKRPTDAPSGASSAPTTKTPELPPVSPESSESSKPDSDDDVGSSKKSTGASKRDLPDFISLRPDDGGKSLRVSLPAPLAAVRASLAACAGPGGKIRVHVVGKKITELRVDGAASKCEPGLIGKSVGLADGWLELQVQ